MILRNRLRRAYFRIVHGRGNDYHCVFCGRSHSRFITFGKDHPPYRKWDVVGAGKRKSAKCPNCLSKDRARLLYLYLRTRTDVFERPTRLLHIAPDLHLIEALSREKTIELVCGNVAHLELIARYDPVHIDVRRMTFDADSFDWVLCNHVTMVVDEEAASLGEIHRVLRPGGKAILQNPIALDLPQTIEGRPDMTTADRLHEFGNKNQVRMYGSDYADRLEEAGFKVTTHNPFEESWVPDVARHGLDPRESVYVAEK